MDLITITGTESAFIIHALILLPVDEIDGRKHNIDKHLSRLK